MTQIEDKGFSAYYRYYIHMISSHDSMKYTVAGNKLAIGYQGIFSPFIPLWYLGEECMEEKNTNEYVLFDHPILWQDKLLVPEINEFYEDIKFMIKIRRSYPKIFNYYPEHFYNTNICKVETNNSGLQAYSRFFENTAILIIPNETNHDSKIKVEMPFENMEWEKYLNCTVMEAKTENTICSGEIKSLKSIEVDVPKNDQAVIILIAE